MTTFADIGKACRDLTGGFTYDHKATYATKVSGAAITSNAVLKADGSQAFDVKAAHNVAGMAVEVSATHTGKATVSVTKADVVKGLKVAVASTVLPSVSGSKATVTYVTVPTATGGKSLAVKSDIGLTGTPKVDTSVAYVHGAVTVGADAEYDTGKGTVGKYTLGLQYAAKEGTAAVLLADKTDTIKASYVHKCTGSVCGGVEVVHKLSKADTSFTVGCSKKMEGASAKATFTSAGVLNMLYTQEIKPKMTGTVCVQLNSKALDKPKFGAQLSMK